jgi:hypothetical protein
MEPDEELSAIREALRTTFAELYEGAEIQVPPVKAIAMLKDDVLCGRDNWRMTHNGYLRLDKIRLDLQAALNFEVKNSAELVDRVVALKACVAGLEQRLMKLASASLSGEMP